MGSKEGVVIRGCGHKGVVIRGCGHKGVYSKI